MSGWNSATKTLLLLVDELLNGCGLCHMVAAKKDIAGEKRVEKERRLLFYCLIFAA